MANPRDGLIYPPHVSDYNPKVKPGPRPRLVNRINNTSIVTRQDVDNRQSNHIALTNSQTLAIAVMNKSFPKFPELPPELRNRIWGFAANNEGRTLDIWTDWNRCEVANTVFYCQVYSTELTRPAVPSILKATREARSEALKHYSLQFRTHMNLRDGTSVIFAPKIYVNYACDTLVPRGYWNIVSFADFYVRVCKGGLVNLAVDVEGSFWRENLRDYCAHGNWPLNGVQEITIYDSRKDKTWKDSDQIERFRSKYKGGVKTLKFKPLNDEEKTQNTKDVELYLEQAFLRMEGKQDAIVEDPEHPNPQSPFRVPKYLDECEKTTPKEFMRPKITVMKLLTMSVEDDDA